jgi:predicted O-methyltransferase YrrM
MGRVLSTAVRFTRPTSCVELGTAYGLSALFLLAELERVSPSGRLTTIEVREPQHGIAKALLEHRHGDAVRCALVGNAQDLPAVLDAARPIDLVFHDAEHSGDAYQRDFELLFPRLAPRAVVIFDNIRWDHKVFSRGPSRTYDGWRAVADDARCLAAVECSGADVGDSWGLVLVRGPAPS